MELGLIGYPIGHSKSPWIHQQFFDQTGIKGSYQLIEIEPSQFEQKIKQLKRSELAGFNVTIPYKEKIIPYLDEISCDAEQIGAVNTVVCRNQRWHGYNTDGMGLVTALKNSFPTLFTGGKAALILGAGGASRGIYYALANENLAAISIANRTISRAKDLLALNQTQVRGNALSFKEAEENLFQFDLIIQTTSVGMTPEFDQQVIDLSQLKKGTVVSDIVYQPFWTALLKDAERRGGFVHHGHEMLLYQAKLAFELWSEQIVAVEPALANFS
ncbi:shikimate dehydrogenase [Amphibacillus sp. Q70]|uniref:shikimate dehydrogenase n=1 Tax=Amphibacillus sp. Q70 TaxID=3453416 RepID=UPI003F832397